MIGMVGGTSGGREEIGERTGAFRRPSPWPVTSSPPAALGAPLTDVLRQTQEGFLVQGVYKDAAHQRLKGGLLGVCVPQPCQETRGDPTTPNTHVSLPLRQGISSWCPYETGEGGWVPPRKGQSAALAVPSPRALLVWVHGSPPPPLILGFL